MGAIYYLYSMNFSKIISQNFLCSGAPTQVATVGIEALDVSTGTLYIQKKIPSGTSWVVKSKNYFQTIDLAEHSVSYDQLQLASGQSKIIGSPGGSQAIGEVVLGTNLSMDGNTLNAVGGESINTIMAVAICI